jgi:hypothetical protein
MRYSNPSNYRWQSGGPTIRSGLTSSKRKRALRVRRRLISYLNSPSMKRKRWNSRK